MTQDQLDLILYDYHVQCVTTPLFWECACAAPRHIQFKEVSSDDEGWAQYMCPVCEAGPHWEYPDARVADVVDKMRSDPSFMAAVLQYFNASKLLLELAGVLPTADVPDISKLQDLRDTYAVSS